MVTVAEIDDCTVSLSRIVEINDYLDMRSDIDYVAHKDAERRAKQ